MLSRRYLQSHLLACIVAFTVLSCSCVVTVLAEESENENVILPSNSQNETDTSGTPSEGLETAATVSYEAHTSTESSATPALSDSLFSAGGTTTDLANTEERATVTILPSTTSLPAMIITATQVTLGHRMGNAESSTESNEGSTGNPAPAPVTTVEEPITDSPSSTGKAVETEAEHDASHESSKKHSFSSNRQSRYHRFHESYIPEEVGQHHREHVEPLADYFREFEVNEAGDSYGDFAEENEIPEQLPTPMALINPNGEGNNPPLEDDFAEAFKKVNGNGKRRRFRGGRGRGRMKMKKANDTNEGSNSFTSTATEHEVHKSGPSEWSVQSTTASPSSLAPKFKRYRSTTPNTGTIMERSSAPSTTPSSLFTEASEAEEASNSPVVKNGPKPMILKTSFDDTSSSSSNNEAVTPMPQIEKPGNGGHTEKISTYFFSTPSPSARLRLRQKIRDNLPSSTSTTLAPTTTTANYESSTEASIKGSDLWKTEFAEFPQNPFFTEISHESKKFKIPDFVPMNLGLEQDDRQDQVENSLVRPDPAEKKTYTLGSSHHGQKSESSSSSSSNSRSYDSSYSGSSTTPKSHKIRRPTSTSDSQTKASEYGTKSRVSPTSETERKPTEYYGQDPSTTFPSAHRPPAGSHYDRTKDRVIFYNDSPYSAQHGSPTGLGDSAPGVSSPILQESTSGPSSPTVGSHISVSEGSGLYDSPLTPSITVDHHHYVSDPNQGMYTRGHVYPDDDAQQLDSTFKNGPPDSSHIHSPNIIEHAQPLSLPTDMPAENQQILRHTHNHEDTYSPQSILEESHHHHPLHQIPGRPAGDSIYGTVEEVPAHSVSPYEHLRHSPYDPRHHNMQPPPPPGPAPYPFGAEYPPPPHAHVMSYPMPPPHLSHNGEHSLPTHPIPPPPPPPHMHAHVHHQQHHVHHSFAPPFPSTENGNNELDSHLNSNNLAGVPSEMSHGVVPMSDQSLSHSDGQPSGSVSSPTAAAAPAAPDFPPSNAAPESAPEPEMVYNGPPTPSPMDHNFPPHSHTMAAQPDYEPANPPLPHDHPFHKSFIPFPPQDLMMPHEHTHDSNLLGAATGGSYHPGIVENVPTGRPGSPFEPSPLIPSKFTPIPDDVKESELYNSFNGGPSHNPHSADGPEGSLSSNQMPDLSSHNLHPHHSSGDGMSAYLDPENPSSPYHHLQHSSAPGPSNIDHSHSDVSGYSGPVNEIHSGVYNHPKSVDHSESYQDHHHSSYIPQEHHSPSDGGFGMHHGVMDHHEHGSDKKPGELTGYDKPTHNEEHPDFDDQSHHTGSPNDIKSSIRDAKKEKKQRQQAAFSNTPYVLMFPQLIPEEKMRPSPPSMLSKEIPVIQASSMNDFTSGSGEKPPLGPGFQAVPVHPRHQMYQVLAKTHYEKMMERYRESKKKPPSAIYTPYGILVPVGTNVDAAASMSHSVFAKPRIPPKFRGEKSLLSALLGSPSNNHGRIHPPMMTNRLTKIFEYEPAIDVLADKLAMKIVNAQQALSQKKVEEKAEEKSDDSSEKAKDKEEHMTMMESKTHATIASPELKQILKGVLKGHLTEMVETSVTSMEDRRPVTLSTKLMNSFFRKGRISMSQPPLKAPSPTPILMQSSGSMMIPQKVPPPPGLHSSQSGPHLHSGIGHPFLPPMPQGPGLLGTIRRLFSFNPPEMRYDAGMVPNFGGRTLYTGNGTHLPYIDGPSPRSSHFAPQIILPHPNMVHQYPPSMQQIKSRMATVPAPPQSLGSLNGQLSSGTTTPKPKKKKKSSSSITLLKKTSVGDDGNWSSTASSSNNNAESVSITTTSSTTTSTAKPKVAMSSSINNGNSYYHRSSSNNNNKNGSSTNMISISSPNNAINSRHQIISKKIGVSGGASFGGDRTSSSSKVKGDSRRDSSSSTKTEVVLSKRLGISSASTDSVKEKTQTSSKPLDMFQTILGSTRSVLNYFKSSEGRKSSGDAPTVLEPRSAPAEPEVETEKNSTSERKRRSPHLRRKWTQFT